MPPHKTAANKAPTKPHEHERSTDLRRAYEHLGRVQALHTTASDNERTVMLTRLAERELAGDHARQAADLLRAAEHFSFAALASSRADETLQASLHTAIQQEFDQKLAKAGEHRDHNQVDEDALEPVFKSACAEAKAAFAAGAYRRALELVRGAEALAHVRLDPARRLHAPAAQGQLAS